MPDRTVRTVTTGMVAVWQSDGTNWRLIAGSVKPEAVYTPNNPKAFTKAEAETGEIPSATRPAVVILRSSAWGATAVTIGAVTLAVMEGNGALTMETQPGERWKATVAVEASTRLK
jgi:hypothetical protein